MNTLFLKYGIMIILIVSLLFSKLCHMIDTCKIKHVASSYIVYNLAFPNVALFCSTPYYRTALVFRTLWSGQFSGTSTKTWAVDPGTTVSLENICFWRATSSTACCITFSRDVPTRFLCDCHNEPFTWNQGLFISFASPWMAWFMYANSLWLCSLPYFFERVLLNMDARTFSNLV